MNAYSSSAMEGVKTSPTQYIGDSSFENDYAKARKNRLYSVKSYTAAEEAQTANSLRAQFADNTQLDNTEQSPPQQATTDIDTDANAEIEVVFDLDDNIRQLLLRGTVARKLVEELLEKGKEASV